jgi:hypothetical protein
MIPFRVLAAMVISTAMLLAGTAQAMEIRKFDKMADQDQAEYVGRLIQAAEQTLTTAGKPQLATQVHRLFLTIPSGDEMSLGMTEFERNLALARVSDAKRAQGDPNARRLEVEDALFVTLKKNGIELPDSFFAANSNFRPKLPMKN